MSKAECRWNSPEQWSQWSAWLAVGLHGRNRWRLPVLLDLKQANPERFCGRFFKVCDGATRAGRRFSGVCEWGVVLSDRVLVVVFLR